MNKRESFMYSLQVNMNYNSLTFESKIELLKIKFNMNIDHLIPILNGEYNENWDLHFFTNGSVLRVGILIHFESIKIKNSLNISHTIDSLFVLLPLHVSGNGLPTIGEIKGYRTSFSELEFSVSYVHSHLPSMRKDIRFPWEGDNGRDNYKCFYDFSFFCLGDSEIQQILAMVSGNFSESTFRLFLMQLNLYLDWESLEGVPYVSINRFLNVMNTEVQEDYGEDSDCDKGWEEIQKSEDFFDNVDFKLKDGKLEAKVTDKLERAIAEAYYGSHHIIYSDGVNYYESNKDYCISHIEEEKMERMRSDSKYKLKPVFLRGKKFEFNIYKKEIPTLDTSKLERRVFPQTRDRIINKINYAANEIASRENLYRE